MVKLVRTKSGRVRLRGDNHRLLLDVEETPDAYLIHIGAQVIRLSKYPTVYHEVRTATDRLGNPQVKVLRFLSAKAARGQAEALIRDGFRGVSIVKGEE